MNQPPPNPYGPPPGHSQGYGPPPGYGPPQGYVPPPYQPPPKKNNNAVIAASVIGGLVVVGVIANVAPKKTDSKATATTERPTEVAAERPAEKPKPAPPPPPKATDVTALKLFQDYQANEVAADETYKGKLLHVSGTVASIDKAFGDPVVQLATSNEFMSVMLHGLSADVAKRLAKGQKFSATCTGAGMFVSPSLSDCVAD